MKIKRNTTIDFLRGLAVILMILIHATAYFLNDPTTRFVWDYTHFAVPLFVFCSGFVFFSKNAVTPLSVSYIWKRLKRLVLPYYIFLLPFFFISFLSKPESLTIRQILEKLFLSGGRDLNWLVILFIYLLFLFPIVHFAYRQKKWVFYVLSGATFLGCILFLFYIPHLPFRFVMWLPWTFFLIFTLVFTKKRANPYFVLSTIILSAVSFIVTRDVLQDQDKTLVLTENKYPPNLYYLSYGIFFTTVLYYLHSFISRNTFYVRFVQKPVDFLSVHSYSLFFIHFLFVKVFVDFGVHKAMGPWMFFIVLLIVSILVQISINNAKKYLISSRH